MADPYIYPSFAADLLSGAIDLATDAVGLLLTTSAYLPDPAHTRRSDITDEVTGTGYTAGGELLTGQTVTTSGTAAVFDADDVTFATVTLTTRRGVLYVARGGADTADNLIACLDWAGDQTKTAEDFIVGWGPAGLLLVGP